MKANATNKGSDAMNKTLESILETHKAWLEDAKQDLWIANHNLRLSQQRDDNSGIFISTIKAQRAEKQIKEYQDFIEYVENAYLAYKE